MATPDGLLSVPPAEEPSPPPTTSGCRSSSTRSSRRTAGRPGGRTAQRRAAQRPRRPGRRVRTARRLPQPRPRVHRQDRRPPRARGVRRPARPVRALEVDLYWATAGGADPSSCCIVWATGSSRCTSRTARCGRASAPASCRPTSSLPARAMSRSRPCWPPTTHPVRGDRVRPLRGRHLRRHRPELRLGAEDPGRLTILRTTGTQRVERPLPRPGGGLATLDVAARRSFARTCGQTGAGLRWRQTCPRTCRHNGPLPAKQLAVAPSSRTCSHNEQPPPCHRRRLPSRTCRQMSHADSHGLQGKAPLPTRLVAASHRNAPCTESSAHLIEGLAPVAKMPGAVTTRINQPCLSSQARRARSWCHCAEFSRADVRRTRGSASPPPDRGRSIAAATVLGEEPIVHRRLGQAGQNDEQPEPDLHRRLRPDPDVPQSQSRRPGTATVPSFDVRRTASGGWSLPHAAGCHRGSRASPGRCRRRDPRRSVRGVLIGRPPSVVVACSALAR